MIILEIDERIALHGSRIQKLYELGAPDRAIERILGLPAKTAWEWRRRNGRPVVDHCCDFWNSKENGGVVWEETVPIRLVRPEGTKV